MNMSTFVNLRKVLYCFLLVILVTHLTYTLDMQHTFFGWWHIKINGADWHIWRRTTSTNSRKLGFRVPVASLWIEIVHSNIEPKQIESPDMIFWDHQQPIWGFACLRLPLHSECFSLYYELESWLSSQQQKDVI